MLVFGTPTLLLLGRPFDETLAILLPASITVSVLQLLRARRGHHPVCPASFARSFACWCLAPLGVTLAVTLVLALHLSVNVLVALVLGSFAMARLVPGAWQRVAAWIAVNEPAWLLVTGVAHGLSNVGGGLLVVLAASHCERKEERRVFIAFCYASFAAVQLVIMAFIARDLFGWTQLTYAGIAAVTFLAIGDRVFWSLSAATFEGLYTAVSAAYALALLVRSTGLFEAFLPWN